MLTSGTAMDFTPVSGFVQTFLVTQEQTHGQYVELEIVLEPGAAGAPLHIHPHKEERFEVKEGVVDVFQGGLGTSFSPVMWLSFRPACEPVA
jgi:uncharacterized cupin superfamily protein